MKNLILILLSIALLGLVYIQALAEPQAPLPRYRIEGYHSYSWGYFEELPYTVLGQMCWNETEGYSCDERIANSTGHRAINRIVDWEAQLVGQVWKNDAGDCWLFMWQSYYIDGNPHPAIQQWVECPQMVYSNEGG